MQFNIFVKDWLRARKITVEDEFEITTQNERIVIPVHDYDGNIIFNKYRRSPLSNDGAKYTYDKGSKVSLYGYHKAKKYKTLLFTEGEMDCLVAWSHNIPSISSTGGSMSFQEEWIETLKEHNVILCFDNDHAGHEGMVRALKHLPKAKVVLLPDIPNVKDISDYVSIGGDLLNLIKTAKSYTNLADVHDDMLARRALFKSIAFHEIYIKANTKNIYKGNDEKKVVSHLSDEVTKARAYPIHNLLDFNTNKKICCIFHNENTPSMVYYPKTNTCYCFGCGKVSDSIEIYRSLHNCSFKEAVKALI